MLSNNNNCTTLSASLLEEAVNLFTDNTEDCNRSQWNTELKFGALIQEGDADRFDRDDEDGKRGKSTKFVGEPRKRMLVSNGPDLPKDLSKLGDKDVQGRLEELRGKPVYAGQDECYNDAHHRHIERQRKYKCAVTIGLLMRAGLSETDAIKYAPTPRSVEPAAGQQAVVDDAVTSLLHEEMEKLKTKAADAVVARDEGGQAAAQAARTAESRAAARDAQREELMQKARDNGFTGTAWEEYQQWRAEKQPTVEQQEDPTAASKRARKERAVA